MALIPIGPWLRDSTYRVHPLRLMGSTYRVPLLDSKLVRLHYAWYYRIKRPSGPSSTLAALGTPQPSFWTLNAVEPRLTYPNLYIARKFCVLPQYVAKYYKDFNVRMLGFKNKIEMRKSRQNNNRPINLPQGNNILHILHVHHLTQNFISRAYTIFNNC